MFDPRLQTKVIKIVDVSYGGENGLNQAIELSQECLQAVKFVQEKKLVSKFFEEIATDSGKYCYGINDTMRALEAGAIEMLLVFENLEHIRVQLRNKETGSKIKLKKKKKKINYLVLNQIFNLIQSSLKFT